jgi:hypothetical protein
MKMAYRPARWLGKSGSCIDNSGLDLLFFTWGIWRLRDLDSDVWREDAVKQEYSGESCHGAAGHRGRN